MKSLREHQICYKITNNCDEQNQSSENIVLQPQSYKIGHAQLSAEIKDRENLRLLNGIAIDILGNQTWNIFSLNEDKKKKWKRIFSFTKKSTATRFDYSGNYNPQLLKEIEPISFPNLKEMNLYSVKIENYEAFTFLQIPCLQYLNIIYNHSPNFKAFDKLNLRSLKVLCIYIRGQKIVDDNIYENYNFSIQGFERCGFNLEELRLEKSDYDAVMMQDISKLAKSKPSLKNVYYCRSNRISQETIRNLLTERKNINFHINEEEQNANRLPQYFNQLGI